MARRVPATTCRPSSTGAYTESLALRRRCKTPGPDCRRLLQKAGGTRVPGRALCETTGEGAGPVGTQQRPRRPPRWIGGGTRRGAADRDQDRPPESWTDGGNGPKVDVLFPRRDTRLESRRGNLEAMHARKRRWTATGTYCRAASGRGSRRPLLHGLAGRTPPALPNTPLREPLWGPDLVVGRRKIRQLDAGGRCSICPGMEIVRRRGCPPRFPFELFWEQQKAYDSGPEKRVWESLEDLQRAAARESSATILGHIAAETARKWLGWELGGALRRGVSRGSGVLPPRRIGGGLDSVRTVASAGLLLLRCAREEMHPKASEGGAAPRGRRHAWGSRTRKPDAEQQGGAFDPLSGVGIPRGYINWCVHLPPPPLRPKPARVEGAIPRAAGRSHAVYAEARRTQCRAAGPLSTRFPVWVYPPAPLNGMLSPPAAQWLELPMFRTISYVPAMLEPLKFDCKAK